MISTWMLLVYFIVADEAFKEKEFVTKQECIEEKKNTEAELKNPKNALGFKIYICVEK